jgi:Ca-activated chloride channel family protein
MDRLDLRARRLAVVVALLATMALAVALFLALGAGPIERTVAGRTLRLASPRWLALLASVPFLTIAAILSVTEAPPRRRALSTALRYTFVTCLGLVLAGPSLARDGSAVSLVALVDASASISDAQLAEEERTLSAVLVAARARQPAAAVRVVRFAAEPEEIAGSPIGRPANAQETDIGLALGLAAGLQEPGRVPRVLLLSDGRATRGEAAARAVRIFWQRPAGGAPDDVAVLDLSAPDDIRPQAGFDLEVRLAATHAGTARLRLSESSEGRASSSERTVPFQEGLTSVRWPERLERSGRTLFRAQILEAGGNARTENDTGVLAVAPRPRPRTLVLEARAASAAPFVRALEAQGIEVDSRAPRAAGSLDPYDLVVLSDVARGALPPGLQAALGEYVRQGGGVLVGGGPESFGSGGYAGTTLAGLLPVRQDPTDQRKDATLALALVIDRSGSMSGPKMDLTKEAARGTAQMLAPDDLISVIVFDSQAHPVVRLQPASNRQRILSDIAQIRASGGTNILPGLREAFDQLFAARARKKHVILLSDGQSPYEGIPELVDDAAAARITVSAVGVGEGADQTLLQMIANRGGGRFYHTRDPASIPQIFTRETAEVSRSSVIEEPTRLRATGRAEALGGLSLETAPPLRGYSRARARPEAEVLLSTGQGDPLLARWQVGLGQVAAWTSDLASRWSADLSRWPSFSKLWGQLARAVMRRGAANHFPLAARLAGDRVQVRIDAVGADDQPLAGLSGTLEVLAVSANGQAAPPRHTPLTETGPGVYEGEASVDGPGALLLTGRLADVEGAPLAEAQGRLAVPFARELLPDSNAASGVSSLEALGAASGGGPATSPDAVLDPGRDSVRSNRSLRTPLLLAAVLLFLADVALRRARLSRS